MNSDRSVFPSPDTLTQVVAVDGEPCSQGVSARRSEFRSGVPVSVRPSESIPRKALAFLAMSDCGEAGIPERIGGWGKREAEPAVDSELEPPATE